MSLPFAAPRHVELVDDVLPVELINRAADRTNDARAMMAVEHVVEQSNRGGHHDVVTIPIAQAFMKMPTDRSALTVRDTPTPIWQPFGFTGDVRWEPYDYSFRVRLSSRNIITGIEARVQASAGDFAFGLRVTESNSTGDDVEYAISFMGTTPLANVIASVGKVERVLINVYGVRR